MNETSYTQMVSGEGPDHDETNGPIEPSLLPYDDFSQFNDVVSTTVINRLMIHHHTMIHFCYVNNFLRNIYIFDETIFPQKLYILFLHG